MAERTTELTPLAKIILAAIGGVVVLTGVVFGGAALFGGGDKTQLVILKAETSDYKKQPADKGGLKINSIDSPVLSLLDKAEELEDGVEILRPPVSEPEPPPIDVTADQPASDQSVTETASSEQTDENVSENADTAAAPKAEIEVIAPAANVTAESENNNQTSDVAAAEPVSITEDNAEDTSDAPLEADAAVDAENEITAAVDSLPQKRPNTPKIVATTDVNSPSYVVQFAAFKNETRAKNTAAVLSTKHKSRLDGMALGYMRWGDYWRVVAEPMPRADANAFCSMFRSVGQECIIKLMESPNG